MSIVASKKQLSEKEWYDYQRVIKCLKFISADRDLISALWLAMDTEEWGLAIEIWSEIPPEDQMALWRAPTKGSIFKLGEREKLRVALNENE